MSASGRASADAVHKVKMEGLRPTPGSAQGRKLLPAPPLRPSTIKWHDKLEHHKDGKCRARAYICRPACWVGVWDHQILVGWGDLGPRPSEASTQTPPKPGKLRLPF